MGRARRRKRGAKGADIVNVRDGSLCMNKGVSCSKGKEGCQQMRGRGRGRCEKWNDIWRNWSISDLELVPEMAGTEHGGGYYCVPGDLYVVH